MKKLHSFTIIKLALFFLLSACTQVFTHELDLTVRNNNQPLANYEIDLGFVNIYSRDAEVTNLANVKTDADGHLHYSRQFWMKTREKFAPRPSFTINSKDTETCSVMLWYLPDKKFFVPLVISDREIKGAIRHVEDIYGNFHRRGPVWTVEAVINRTDRLCEYVVQE